MKMQKLSPKELKTINGGVIPLAVAWGLVKIVSAAATVAYGAGYAIGKFNAHRENNSYEKID